MHFDDATHAQLLQIAIYEKCPIEYKYEACRELQLRQWHDDMLVDLVRLWGQGSSAFRISIELGIAEWRVKEMLSKYGLYKKRVG